jgi:cation diffusion facilitator CzcD-associated flavoprotein CzcO
LIESNKQTATDQHIVLSDMTVDKRVAVIGAGISGVVAAAHLKNEGLDVTVFERSSAAGGIWYDLFT